MTTRKREDRDKVEDTARREERGKEETESGIYIWEAEIERVERGKRNRQRGLVQRKKERTHKKSET